MDQEHIGLSWNAIERHFTSNAFTVTRKTKKKLPNLPVVRNLRLSQESTSSNGRRSNRSSQNFDFGNLTEESPVKTPSKYKNTTFMVTSTSIKKERRLNDLSDIEIGTTEKKKPKIYSYEDESLSSNFSSEEKVKKNTRFFNDFDVKEVIGKGSFGKVYKCIKKVDGLEYAVKETFRKFTGKNKSHALNEAQALASLTAIDDNPNIIRYYSSWVEDEKLFLVMEYCPLSLKQEKRLKGSLTEHEIKKVLRDICVGLKYIHSQEVVHLDIKPGDLGQSRLAVKTSEDIEEGDSRYLAPELLNYDLGSQHQTDLKKADIFCLGMTLYELATNSEIPSNGDEWHDLREGRLYKLDEVHGISEGLKTVIRKMLDNCPDNRPSAAEILSHFVPSKTELELKWQKLEHKLLLQTHNTLQNMLENNLKRRNSL